MLETAPAAPTQAVGEAPFLPVLYRDSDFAIVSKPAQLLVHRSAIANGDTVFALQCAREQFGCRVWIVHRLDRGTSGVLIFAFSQQAAADLGRLMMDGGVHKRYAAVVRGWPEPVQWIDHPLRPVVDPYLRQTRTGSQEALSLVRTWACGEVPVASPPYESTRLGWVSVEIFTGRRHQIRRHLKWAAHPVIGDATYGKGPINRALQAYFGVDRLMLHAAKIRFMHPYLHCPVEVTAPLEARMAAVVERMGWGAAWQALLDAPWAAAPVAATQADGAEQGSLLRSEELL